ncbi:unnamed protein product [Cladocopium goreaui]|uniref:Endonuclease/exonuclease/phosphatase domain-containing protein n=1 Tax=Cladocopium goreaui TaxID=2562237 RepID=A0A9P1DV73_9DINO|nr:unnamed protein product [Cladocopium goreaui]
MSPCYLRPAQVLLPKAKMWRKDGSSDQAPTLVETRTRSTGTIWAAFRVPPLRLELQRCIGDWRLDWWMWLISVLLVFTFASYDIDNQLTKEKDVYYIKKIMDMIDSYPWHCACGRLNGKRHTHCPACKGHWSAGTPHSNEPKSPRVYHSSTEYNTGWDWTNNQQKATKKGKKNQRWRSESARRSGKGKGKGFKGQDATLPSPFAQPAPPAIPPWPNPEATTAQQQAPIAPATSAAHHAELLSAVRKHYPDLSQAPEDIQKAVDKSEKATTKVLTSDLNKASKQVGKAARQLSTVKDARALHRQNWLKHLRDSVASWQKQLQLFKDQQKEHGEQLTKAQKELNTARRHLQNLNKQAAEIGAPVSTETGEVMANPADQDNCPNFEAEAQALVQQVQESLEQSIAAASADKPVELMSDEEEEDADLCLRNNLHEPLMEKKATEEADAYCRNHCRDAASHSDLRTLIRCHSIHWDPKFISEPVALGRATLLRSEVLSYVNPATIVRPHLEPKANLKSCIKNCNWMQRKPRVTFLPFCEVIDSFYPPRLQPHGDEGQQNIKVSDFHDELHDDSSFMARRPRLIQPSDSSEIDSDFDDQAPTSPSSFPEHHAWQSAHVYDLKANYGHGRVHTTPPEAVFSDIRRLLGYCFHDVADIYDINPPPDDLRAANTAPFLLLAHDDVRFGDNRRAILVDVELHGPNWDSTIEIDRYTTLIPTPIHRSLILKIAGVLQYCTTMKNRCLLWHRGSLIPAKSKGNIDLHHGDYVRIAVPPFQYENVRWNNFRKKVDHYNLTNSHNTGSVILKHYGRQSSQFLWLHRSWRTKLTSPLHFSSIGMFMPELGQGILRHPWNECADALAGWAASHPDRAGWSTFWEVWLNDEDKLCALQWIWYAELMQCNDPRVPRLFNGNLISLVPRIPIDEHDLNAPGSAEPLATSISVNLTIATANVLTLDQSSSSTSVTRQLLLMQQFHQAHCTIVGVQETRHRHLAGHNNELYHIFGHCADERGQDGIQLWISKQLPYTSEGDRIGREDVRILDSGPSFLVAKIKTTRWTFIVVTCRAPHSGRPRYEAVNFWRHLDTLLKKKGGGHPIFFCGDTNAHLGEVITDSVGDFHPVCENQAGQVFHEWLLQYELFVPATFSDHHQGESATFCSPHGHETRIDYVALPLSLSYDKLVSRVSDEIDLSIARCDHRAVICQVHFVTASRQDRPRSRNVPLDVHDLTRNLAHAEYQHFLHSSITVPNWSLDPHSSAAWLSTSTSAVLPQLAKPRVQWRRKSHISTETWCLVDQKKNLFKQLRALKKAKHQTILRACFVGWRTWRCDAGHIAQFERDLPVWFRLHDLSVATTQRDFKNAAQAAQKAIRHEDGKFYQQIADQTTRTFPAEGLNGSPLADIGFNLMMSALLSEIQAGLMQIEDCTQGATELGTYVPPIAWMDDVAICLTTSQAIQLVPLIQDTTKIVHAAFRKRGLTLNLDKGKSELIVMFRGPGAVAQRTLLFDIENQPRVTTTTETHILSMRVISSYRHLGVRFAMNLDYDREVIARVGAAHQAFAQMRKAIFCNKAIPLPGRLVLFQSLVLSRLLYGCAVWAELSAASYRKLEATVTGFYRRICNTGFWSSDHLTDQAFLQSSRLVSFRIFWARHRLCYLHHLASHGHTFHKSLLLMEFQNEKGWLFEVADDLRWMAKFHELPFDIPVDRAGWISAWSALRDCRPWRKWVVTAVAKHLEQEKIAYEIGFYHRQIQTELEEAGMELAPAPSSLDARKQKMVRRELQQVWDEGQPDYAWWEPNQSTELTARCHQAFDDCLQRWFAGDQPDIVSFHNLFFATMFSLDIPEFQAARLFIHWSETCFADFVPHEDQLDYMAALDEAMMTLLEDLHIWKLRLRYHQLQRQLLFLEQEEDEQRHNDAPQDVNKRKARLHPIETCYDQMKEQELQRRAWRMTTRPNRRAAPVQGPYFVIHFYAGRRREADFHFYMSKLIADCPQAWANHITVISLDTAIDSSMNVHSERLWSWLLSTAKEGRILGFLLGPPCETWSSARHELNHADDGALLQGPRPLRHAEACWGIPGLYLRELKQLSVGSCLLLRGLWLCIPIALTGGAVMLEHPAPPYQEDRPSIFRTGLVTLLLREGWLFRRHTFQQWRHGSKGVKPTTLLFANNKIPDVLAEFALRGIERPTEALIGRNESGKFKTEVAKEYPSNLCSCFATAIWRHIEKLPLGIEGEAPSCFAVELADASARVDPDRSYLPDYQPQ